MAIKNSLNLLLAYRWIELGAKTLLNQKSHLCQRAEVVIW